MGRGSCWRSRGKEGSAQGRVRGLWGVWGMYFGVPPITALVLGWQLCLLASFSTPNCPEDTPLPRGHPGSRCCRTQGSSCPTRGPGSVGVPNHPHCGSATNSRRVRGQTSKSRQGQGCPGDSEEREGDRTLGAGGGVRAWRWGSGRLAGDGTREFGGRKQGYFLHLAGLSFASGTSACSWQFSSEMGISGSSSHQALRCFTPDNYQQLLQC